MGAFFTFFVGSISKYLLVGGLILGILGICWGHGFMKGRESIYHKIIKIERYYNKKILKLEKKIDRLKGRDKDRDWIPWLEHDEEELKQLEREARPILDKLRS